MRWRGATVLMVACLLLAGCGSNSQQDAKHAAATFMSALYSGHAASACALETPATRSAQNAAGTLLSRFTSVPAGPCSLARFGVLGKAFFARRPVITQVVVRGSRASAVVYDGNSVEAQPHRLNMDEDDGKWLVAERSYYTSNYTARKVARDTQFYSQACLKEWNSWVFNGEITLPNLSGPSDEIWADLEGKGSTPEQAPCSVMSIRDRATGTCSSLIQNSSTGAWTTYPCTNTAKAEAALRDVWLAKNGLATPAYFASPDGSVHALPGVPLPTYLKPSTGKTQTADGPSNTTYRTATPAETKAMVDDSFASSDRCFVAVVADSGGWGAWTFSRYAQANGGTCNTGDGITITRLDDGEWQTYWSGSSGQPPTHDTTVDGTAEHGVPSSVFMGLEAALAKAAQS